MNEQVPIGYIQKAHSIRGEVFLRLRGDSRCLQYLTKIGDHNIESHRPHKDGVILKLEGVKDRTLAESFVGTEVSISKEKLVGRPGEKPFLAEFLGFQVLDAATEKAYGKIHDFRTGKIQDLAVVDYEGSQYVFPFVKELTRIDYDKNVIYVQALSEYLEIKA